MIIELPVGVVLKVETVSVLVQVELGVHEAGEKLAVAPSGSPLAEKVTASVTLEIKVVVMVLATDWPWFTDLLPLLDKE